MKICWDNLKNLSLTTQDKFTDGRYYYVEKDACKSCGFSFLSRYKHAQFCSISCAKKGEFHHLKKSPKYTVDMVKEILLKDGYDLIYNERHINTTIKFDCVCSNGHEYRTNLNRWLSGKRCKKCSVYASLGIEKVRSSLLKEGYILLETQYANANTPMQCVCNNGHRIIIYWSNWYRGIRCPCCAGNNRNNIDDIKDEFTKDNYTLLSTRYKNNNTKLNYICPLGHRHSISYANWSKGRRCPICALINHSGENHYNWKGGISCEPYCDAWKDKEYKNSIKERDNYKCQNPDCWGTSNRLAIHHIDYNKKNCGPDNLITLCNSCNARANHNREWHKEFYTKLMLDGGVV